MAGAELDVDVRIDFIGDVCMKVFSIDEDMWLRFSTSHENHRKFAEFLDSNDEPRQLIVTFAEYQLEVTNQPITLAVIQETEKAVYFLKKDPEPVSTKHVRDNLVFGTLGHDVLSQILSFLSEEVLVKMVQSEQVDPFWTSTVKDDLIHITKEAAIESGRIKKRCKGETELTVREGVFADNLSGPAQVAEAEALALMWEQLLKSMPLSWESDLHDEKYWVMRCSDLERIYEQLTTDVSKKASALLEKSGSIHTNTMRKIIVATVAALAETKSILQHISSITTSFSKVIDLEESEESLESIRNRMEDFLCVFLNAQQSCDALKSGTCAQKLLYFYTTSLLDRIAGHFSCSLFFTDCKEFRQKAEKARAILHKFRLTITDTRENSQSCNETVSSRLEKSDTISVHDRRSVRIVEALFQSFFWKLDAVEDIIKRSNLLARIDFSQERLTPETLLLLGRLKAIVLDYKRISSNEPEHRVDHFLKTETNPDELERLKSEMEALTRKLKMIVDASDDTQCIFDLLEALENLA